MASMTRIRHCCIEPYRDIGAARSSPELRQKGRGSNPQGCVGGETGRLGAGPRVAREDLPSRNHLNAQCISASHGARPDGRLTSLRIVCPHLRGGSSRLERRRCGPGTRDDAGVYRRLRDACKGLAVDGPRILRCACRSRRCGRLESRDSRAFAWIARPTGLTGDGGLRWDRARRHLGRRAIHLGGRPRVGFEFHVRFRGYRPTGADIGLGDIGVSRDYPGGP